MQCVICHQPITYRKSPKMDPRILPTQHYECLCEQHAVVYLRMTTVRLDAMEADDVRDVMMPTNPPVAMRA